MPGGKCPGSGGGAARKLGIKALKAGLDFANSTLLTSKDVEEGEVVFPTLEAGKFSAPWEQSI